MSSETKLMARVPIIPADFLNTSEHKVDELVMNHTTNDILVKTTNGYVNITGRIKEEIQQITDGTSVIHIVTEDSVPPVIDRKENHWYYIITSAEEYGGGSTTLTNYVYYGIVDNGYDLDTNYIIIGQNVFPVDPAAEYVDVTITMREGYNPIFYVPISMVINCTINGTRIPFTNGDNPMETIYSMNTTSGQWTAYRVWVLNTTSITITGQVTIRVYFTANDTNTITFAPRDPVPPDLVLPPSFTVPDGQHIGELPQPTWSDGLYIFRGYSSRVEEFINVPSTYIPLTDMTLYAFFTHNESPTALTYTSNEIGGE